MVLSSVKPSTVTSTAMPMQELIQREPATELKYPHRGKKTIKLTNEKQPLLYFFMLAVLLFSLALSNTNEFHLG
jgi:hypothetical protein